MKEWEVRALTIKVLITSISLLSLPLTFSFPLTY
jgi:hypothetical protein